MALRTRSLLITYLNLGNILLCILRLLCVIIVGIGDIQHMLVILKVLNVRSLVIHTEWRTTDTWLDIARPIPSPTLLEKLLQIVHLVITLSSIWTAKRTMLLPTTSVYSSVITLTRNTMLTRLLRCTLDKSTAVLQNVCKNYALVDSLLETQKNLYDILFI